jgi:Zn-dependent protease
LGFVLNVLVGIVNLLPIPPFDGYRILSLKLGGKKLYGIKIMDAIVALIVGAFLANLLPWLWI